MVMVTKMVNGVLKLAFNAVREGEKPYAKATRINRFTQAPTAMHSFFLKSVRAVERRLPKSYSKRVLLGAMTFGAIGGAKKQFGKVARFKNMIDTPTNISYGPGYISWSKTEGMPANHLSTDGLSLALSKNRHISTI